MRRLHLTQILIAFSLCVAHANRPALASGEQVIVDEKLVGLVISASVDAEGPRDLRIAAVRKDPDSNGMLYTLTKLEDRASLCGNHTGGQPVEALPFSGHWDTRMAWHPDGLTFACTDGILAKCVRLGYVPWAERPDADMRALHQTCARMIRADYCGDGVPHTEEGTPINVWDTAIINTKDVVGGMSFEAAWGPNGALRIERTRFPQEMAYVHQHCPERLAANGATADGALIFNESYPR